MSKALTTTALTLGLLLAGGSWAQAQQDAGSASGASTSDKGGTTGALSGNPRSVTEDAAGTRGTEVSPPSSMGADATANPIYRMRGNEIIGKTLYGAAGEEIGEVGNVAMRMGGLRPEAIVDVGGFLGIGGRQVAIPLDRIQLVGDRLTTTLTKENIGSIGPYDEAAYDDYDRSYILGGTAQ